MHSYIFFFKAAVRILLARTLGLNLLTKTSGTSNSSTRVLFISNSFIPTLQLSFFKPLANAINRGELAASLLSEQQMRERFGKRYREAKVEKWIERQILKINPTIMIFCRYSGPHSKYMTTVAQKLGVATVFHIDDDLLNVPPEIGYTKHLYHSHPLRLDSVRYLLNNVDLIYCSTEALKQRLASYGFNSNIKVGEIYCSGQILAPANNRPVTKIGYMGFDHAHDLNIVVPALIQVLNRNPTVKFELFGSIPKPLEFEEFGNRVRVIPPVESYGKFLKKFTSLQWDIGICPLAQTDFNTVKANTKWVEYTSVGSAVVASANTVYDACCNDGCGILATTTDEWVDALESLIKDKEKRFRHVTLAQERLSDDYSVERLELQVLEVLRSAKQCLN